MRREVILGSGAAFAVGALTAGQSRLNGELALETGNGLQSASISMFLSFLIASVIVVVIPSLRRALAGVFGSVRLKRLEWWKLMGGVFAALFLASQSLFVPILGVAVFTIALVAGQLTNSVVVDRLGWGPAGVQVITGARVMSAVLAAVAVGISVSDRWNASAGLAVVPLIIAVVAGGGMAIQQAMNGFVAQESREPMAASWVNFTVGLSVLLGVTAGLWVFSDVDPGPVPWDRPYLLLGGIVGVLFIATAAWVVQVVGILSFALLTILGQLVGAALLDLLVPADETGLHLQVIVGVVVAAVAVAVGSLPKMHRAESRNRTLPE